MTGGGTKGGGAGGGGCLIVETCMIMSHGAERMNNALGKRES